MGLRTVNASVCVHDFVFYSHFALSYLSLKISEDHCDFPADYTLQLFNTFEDKWVCHVSHHMVFFSPLWKGHLTINTVIWQLNIKQWIRCLLINWVILCTRACYTGEYGCRFSCCDTSFLLAACASAVVSLFSEVFTEDSSWLLFFCTPQSQYQDNHVAGPPLGKEGKAPWEVRGWRYVYSFAQLVFWSVHSFH